MLHTSKALMGNHMPCGKRQQKRSCPRQDFRRKSQNITQPLHNLQHFNHKVSQNPVSSLFTCPSTSAFRNVWLRLAEAAEEVPAPSRLGTDKRHIKTHPALNQRVTAGHNMAALCEGRLVTTTFGLTTT